MLCQSLYPYTVRATEIPIPITVIRSKRIMKVLSFIRASHVTYGSGKQ